MQFLRSENTGSLNSSSGALRHAYAQPSLPSWRCGCSCFMCTCAAPYNTQVKKHPMSSHTCTSGTSPCMSDPVLAVCSLDAHYQQHLTGRVLCLGYADASRVLWLYQTKFCLLLFLLQVLFCHFLWFSYNSGWCLLLLLFNSSTVSWELIVFLFHMVSFGQMLLSFEYSTPPQLFTLTGLAGVVIQAICEGWAIQAPPQL